MKLKKVLKILPCYVNIRVWGNDDNKPLYIGLVKDLPKILENLKLIKGEEDSYFEIRHDCSDCEDHVAIFVKEE